MSESKRPAKQAAFSKKSALLIIDLQKDFVSGTLKAQNATDVVPVIENLRQLRFHMIVWTQDWHPKGHDSFASTQGADPFTVKEMPDGTKQTLWPDHCVQGTEGAELVLAPQPRDVVVRKGTDPHVDSYSAFWDNNRAHETELAGLLRKADISDVYLCGLCLDYCVGWTAEDALKTGFIKKVFVIQDATKPCVPASGADMTGSLQRKGCIFVSAAEVPRRDERRGDVADYMARHDVNGLFEKLCASLLYNRPQDPYTFLSGELKRIGQEKTGRSGLSLLTDADIETAWNKADTQRKGELPSQDVARLLTDLGVSWDAASQPTVTLQQFKQFAAAITRKAPAPAPVPAAADQH